MVAPEADDPDLLGAESVAEREQTRRRSRSSTDAINAPHQSILNGFDGAIGRAISKDAERGF